MKSTNGHCYLFDDGRVVKADGRKTRWIFRKGPPEKQSQSNLRWMRLISPNNNRREAVLLSRRAQTMAIHANPWPEPAVLPMWKFLSLSIAIHLLSVASATPLLPTSLHLYVRLHLRLPRISREWSPMMPDYRSLLEEEGKRLELGIRAAERQGEVSFAWRSLNP